MSRLSTLLLAGFLCCLPAGATADAVVGTQDDFSGAHTWVGNSENIPCGTCGFPPFLCLCPAGGPASGVTTVANGGPAGALDAYLQLSELPSFGLETWNLATDRTGDYLTAGIGSVTADLKNFGGTALEVRLGLQRAGTRWVSSDAAAAALPASSGWLPASFELSPASMVLVAGSESLAFVMSDVDEIRILHSVSEQWDGDGDGPLGVDNVYLPEPGGRVGLWGVALLGLLARGARSRR